MNDHFKNFVLFSTSGKTKGKKVIKYNLVKLEGSI